MTRKPTAWSVIMLMVATCAWAQRDDTLLRVWREVRRELQSERGPKYFEEGIKERLVPGTADYFRGRLLAMRPETNPTELTLAVEQADVADALLRIEGTLKGTMPIGSILKFQGIVTAYKADPYLLTFDVDSKSLQGWTGK